MTSPGAIGKVIEIVIRARNETGAASTAASSQIKSLRSNLLAIGAVTAVVAGVARAIIGVQEAARAAGFEVVEFNRRVAAGEEVISRQTERVRALAASMDPGLTRAYEEARYRSDALNLAFDRSIVQITRGSSLLDFLRESFMRASLGIHGFNRAMAEASAQTVIARLETERFEKSKAIEKLNKQYNDAIKKQREKEARAAKEKEGSFFGMPLGSPAGKFTGESPWSALASSGFDFRSAPILDLFPVDEVRKRIDDMEGIMQGFADTITVSFGGAIDSMGNALGAAVVFHENFAAAAKNIWKGFVASVIAEVGKLILRLLAAAVIASFLPGVGGFSTAAFSKAFKMIGGFLGSDLFGSGGGGSGDSGRAFLGHRITGAPVITIGNIQMGFGSQAEVDRLIAGLSRAMSARSAMAGA